MQKGGGAPGPVIFSARVAAAGAERVMSPLVAIWTLTEAGASFTSIRNACKVARTCAGSPTNWRITSASSFSALQ